ncbi:MAG: putative porin [Candidatus Omnitrophica bacterium]|nr:putative porin [Candidatus Omnitrophota bacterium]
MRRFLGVFLISMFSLMCFNFNKAYAGEIDLLLQKLVEKGVLTPGEAQQVKTETKEEIRKEIVSAKYELLPEWVQRLKFKGDFRMRYQYTRQRAKDDTNQARIRVRLGAEAKVNDQMKVGLGLATGSTSDPRSTNVTLGNDPTTPGASKTVILDYAYGSYSPTTWLTLTGGKFKNPIWQPTDLLWDTDLNPEGLNMQMDYRLNPSLGLFLNTEMFVLGYDDAKGLNSLMWAFQPGIKYNWRDKVDLRAAVTGYYFSNITGVGKFAKQSTNSLTRNNQYKYHYNVVNPSLEVGIRDPFSSIPVLAKYIPYAGMFSDFVYNPDPDTGKSGFDAGIKFGHEKVGDWGQWQSRILFSKLGRDAFLDIFPDSDRYNGKTNMKSVEAILEYGLGKNTSLCLDYYWAKSLSQQTSGSASGSYLPQQVVQVDWNLKW